jgi:hypothetical protein
MTDRISLIKIIQTLIGLCALTGCGEKKFSMTPPYKAVVLAFTGKGSTGKAEFALEERTFRTMTDFNELDGTYLKIRRGGKLTIKEIDGSLVTTGRFSGGESPGLRYQVKGGAAIALDYSTLAMLSAFYQFDQIYSTVEETLGVPPSQLQTSLSNGKHSVLFEPEITFSEAGTDISAGQKLNAAFNPLDKTFILFQRSPVEVVPLAANFQVMSHEFGHFVFDHSFYGGKYDKELRWTDEWAVNGINEGFADFISWTFSDVTDVLRSSFDIESVADERDFANSKFVFQDLADEDSSACKGSFYCVGSLFARSLFEAFLELKTISKKDYAKDVINSLKNCLVTLQTQPESVLPAEIDRDTLVRAKEFEYDGKVAGAFLASFVVNAPPAWKAPLCSAFKKNFGTSGFPPAARAVSCDSKKD